MLLLLLPCAAMAQDPLAGVKAWFENLGKPPPPKPPDPGAQDTFTVSPIAFTHGQLGVEYERALGPPISIAVEPEFAYTGSKTDWQLSLAGTLALRLFVLGSAPSGIYFGPEVSALWLRSRHGDVLTTALGLGIGGGVGWTIVFFNRFTLSAGFSAHFSEVPDPENGPDAVRTEISALPRLNFGVAF